MSKAKAILISPNPRTMSLVSPVVSHFYNILKANDIEMKYFDTTLYDLSDKYVNAEKKIYENFSAKEVREEHKVKIPGFGTTLKNREELLLDFRKEVEDYQPDVILTSVMECTVRLMREMLSHIHDLKVPHIVGGVFPTYAPDLAISYPEIDVLCVGEAEHIIAELVLKVKKGESLKGFPNTWYKDKDGNVIKNKMAPPNDIDELPRFDVAPFHDSRFYRAMAGKIYRMFPVETHRGCTQKCTFCNSPVQDELYLRETDQRYFRLRSIPKVMEDIKYFIEECKADYLFFWADHFFTYSRAQIDEFCEAYKQYKIPFYIQSYPSAIDDYKLTKLAEVGLNRIGMGIEHGNEKFRNEVIKRPYSNERAIKKMEIVQEFNIQYSCNNIVGFPHETPAIHWDTIELNRALKADSASCAIFTPFHGTPLRRMALEEGFLKDPNALAPSNFDYSILDMPQFPADLIEAKARVFNLYVMLPKSRWKDVEKAEKKTPEGNRIFEELRQEIKEKEAEC